MPTATCNGLDLYYGDAGSGEAVVFLNGLAGDHLYWNSQVRTLSPRFRCLSLDNRDVGQSAYSDQSYTCADLAEDVVAFLDVLGVPAAHVVGLSLGGMLAQELAIRHPQRVLSLVLTNTLGRCDEWFGHLLDAFCLIRRQVPDTPRFFEAVLPWLISHRYFEQPGAVEWLKALFYRNPHPQRAEGFFRQIDAIRTHDALDRLGQVRCPVLVVAGEDDTLTPARYARKMVERLPSARLEILPGVGHAPPIEAPRPFNRLLSEFLP
jgi:pimeloyl-ACP methyl ester carboxylesterase